MYIIQLKYIVETPITILRKIRIVHIFYLILIVHNLINFLRNLAHQKPNAMNFKFLLRSKLLTNRKQKPVFFDIGDIMAEKPTYEELEQRLKALNKEASAHRQAEQNLKRAVQEKSAILDALLEHVVYQDTDMSVLWANQAACNSVGGLARMPGTKIMAGDFSVIAA